MPRERQEVTDERPWAVIAGLDCITGLQTARILAALGVPVAGIAWNPNHPFCRARAVRRVHEQAVDEASLADGLVELADEIGAPTVLIPARDEAVRAISSCRSRLADRFILMLPEADDLDLLMDKSRFHRHATQERLPVPRGFLLRSPTQAEEVARELEFPVVVKPSRRSAEWLRAVQSKVFKADDTETLRRLAQRCLPWTEELIVQEWVAGTDADMYSLYSCLNHDSLPLAAVVARKLRQWPPETGVGCLAVQVDEPAVVEKGLALLRSVRYRGLSSVQFKRDRRSGELYFIEANVGRPALNMPLAEVCGIPLHYTFYCAAAGLPLPPERELTRPGGKWICWKTDLASALEYRRRGELSLREWWRSIRGPKWCGVWSWRDPGPFLLDVLRKTGTNSKA